MKSLSTSDLTQKLLQKLKSANCYSYTKATYVNDSGVEVDFTEDLLYPIDIQKEGRPPRYANINYEPAAADCSFSVINKSGEYSPKNTASALRDVFKRDRVVKFYSGNYLTDGGTATAEAISISGLDITHYFSKLDGSNNIVLDHANTGGNTLNYFDDIFALYDEETYDDSTYAPEAYTILDIDRLYNKKEIFNSIDIVSATANVDVYYRFGNAINEIENGGNNSDKWNYYGGLIAGTTNIDLGDTSGARFIQIGLVFKTGSWSSGASISSLTLNYTNYVEWVLLGSFLLDDPKFKEKRAPEISTISITGRNAWKKALDTRINIKDLSGGVSIDQLIKDIADLANLTYTASSIADLSAYGNRSLSTGYDEQVSPAEIYRDILQIIGKDYRLRIDDNNVLYTELRPTAYTIEYVFNYQNYIEAVQGEESDRKIQRITIQTDSQVLDPYQELDNDSFTDVTTGTINWGSVGGAVAKDFTATTVSGDIAVTDVEYNNTSAVFTFSGSGTINITVSGCPFRSTEPTYYGEAANSTNIVNKDGYSFREINPLVISDAESKTIAENFVDEFGTAEYNVKVQDSYVNPLLEVNDPVLLVSENFLETQVYEVLGIRIKLNSEVDKTSEFELIDTGRDLLDQANIVWDRDLYNVAANFTWDSGIIWDANYAIGTTSATITAADNRFVDVDFT